MRWRIKGQKCGFGRLAGDVVVEGVCCVEDAFGFGVELFV